MSYQSAMLGLTSALFRRGTFRSSTPGLTQSPRDQQVRTTSQKATRPIADDSSQHHSSRLDSLEVYGRWCIGAPPFGRRIAEQLSTGLKTWALRYSPTAPDVTVQPRQPDVYVKGWTSAPSPGSLTFSPVKRAPSETNPSQLLRNAAFCCCDPAVA